MSDKDLPNILEVFSVLHFCPPPNIEEVIRLANFYWKFVDCYFHGYPYYWSKCSDMRTIGLATMNNILSEGGGVLYNMNLVYEFFSLIDRAYNFTLGPALLSLVTKSELTELAKRDYPFLRNYKHCLLDPECSIMADGTRDLRGKNSYSKYHCIIGCCLTSSL